MDPCVIQAAGLFKALGHPTRLAIVDMLSTGERCVCELCPELGVEQSTLSKHLAVLRSERVVYSSRDGSRVMYQLADDRIAEVVAIVRRVLGEGVHEQAVRWARTMTGERGEGT